MKNQRLILIRHAHRDTENPSLNNGLSEKGLKQVKHLRKFAEKRDLQGARFISSPKQRCIETIEYVAKDQGQELQIENAIGEGTTLDQLETFIQEWKYDGPELLVACSHGDVIPLLVERMTGGLISIKKAGWCEIERVGNECYLTLLVQNVE